MTYFNDRLLIGRRELLYSLGSFAVITVAGCGGDSMASPTSPSSTPTAATPAATTPIAATPATGGSSNASCVVTPALTEGPYFVDERLNRSDIRTDPASGVARAGVPVTIAIQLSQIAAAGTCSPLADALVDMWHCDAGGLYSDISGQRTTGERFLRGYQLSDANGAVRFTTIYPGWYMGRAVHIHFKVRTNPAGSRGLEFTSQMFFDESLTDTVHAQAPYSIRGRRDTTNSSDGIFRDGGTSLLLPLSASAGGYAGTFNVGVRA